MENILSRHYTYSKVEIQEFSVKHYDSILIIASLVRYSSLIKNAIGTIRIPPEEF